MAGIIFGGLVGMGLALTGFFVFRWADHRFLDRPAGTAEEGRKAQPAMSAHSS